VIRKHMGYDHIAAPHAAAVEAFYRETFNPYLNFHRPCGVPEEVVGAKGKVKRVCWWYATPWEILRQLPDLARHLKGDLTIHELERLSRLETDTAAAAGMQAAKEKLFTSFERIENPHQCSSVFICGSNSILHGFPRSHGAAPALIMKMHAPQAFAFFRSRVPERIRPDSDGPQRRTRPGAVGFRQGHV